MNTINTINQLVKIFKEFTILHGQINDFGFGGIQDFGASRSMQYPALWATTTQPGSISIDNRNIVPSFRFTFLFIDQINSQINVGNENGLASDNGQEIISDQMQTALDFITWFRNKDKKNFLLESPSFDFIYNETKDKVYGVRVDMTIKALQYNCGMPTKNID